MTRGIVICNLENIFVNNGAINKIAKYDATVSNMAKGPILYCLRLAISIRFYFPEFPRFIFKSTNRSIRRKILGCSNATCITYVRDITHRRVGFLVEYTNIRIEMVLAKSPYGGTKFSPVYSRHMKSSRNSDLLTITA